MLFDRRPLGIRSAGELPWGSHLCVFYASRKEMLDFVVPFLTTGLQCNEFCSWEVSSPFSEEEATAALVEAVPDFARHRSLGQIEIVPPPEEALRQERTDESIVRRVDRAILAGFDGLRLVRRAGSGAHGRAFPAGAETICSLNVVAAFLYPRAEIDAVALMHVVQEHRFALLRESGQWKVLEGSEARRRLTHCNSQHPLIGQEAT